VFGDEVSMYGPAMVPMRHQPILLGLIILTAFGRTSGAPPVVNDCSLHLERFAPRYH
jgi:hypothetical protein